MNENINLVEILKDCPKGTKLYTPLAGDVVFYEIEEKDNFPIRVKLDKEGLNETMLFAKYGGFLYPSYGECLLFPSKDQRDWSKFKAPCKKTGHFDPKTLQPFDRVLVRHSYAWRCELLSHYREYKGKLDFYCTNVDYVYSYCIPYNEDTKHLVGTANEAPEYYRYWEDQQ